MTRLHHNVCLTSTRIRNGCYGVRLSCELICLFLVHVGTDFYVLLNSIPQKSGSDQEVEWLRPQSGVAQTTK